SRLSGGPPEDGPSGEGLTVLDPGALVSWLGRSGFAAGWGERSGSVGFYVLLGVDLPSFLV
ncbi:MAG TPA: hypothetical protein VMU45_03735, partial [Candidatus Eisenbacteria bacterium]|nr:hypothetical protein [Candidatus Eisenbacteria bacterium]